MVLIEAVPNFSEGRRTEVIEHIKKAVLSVPGLYLIDVESNESHNRSVFTFVGDFQAVKEGMLKAAEVAINSIDLNTHKGEHPRMGAVDVIPFIPVEGVKMEEVVIFSKSFAEEYAKRFDLPVFLYGESARDQAHADLSTIREGEFEGIKNFIGKNEFHTPDYGPSHMHPTAGATAVGARDFLVAYNIYLPTEDVRIAKSIAKSVRNSGGGLRYVKALGFDIKEKKMVQVSMNMVNYSATPLHMANELVKSEAKRYGLCPVEGEVVGAIPVDALIESAKYYLQLNNFSRDQILDKKLDDIRETRMHEWRLSKFMDKLSSRDPVPGGGSAAAMCSAAAISLVIMALSISVKESNGEFEKLLSRLYELRNRSLLYIDLDAESFNGVMDAMKIPKEKGEERAAAMEKALKEAAESPLELIRSIAEGFNITAKSRDLIKKNIASDMLSGAHLLHASALSALENVKINLKYMKNEQIKETISRESEHLMASVESTYREIIQSTKI